MNLNSKRETWNWKLASGQGVRLGLRISIFEILGADEERTGHTERSEARRGGLFLVENKQKQIPLPRAGSG